MGILKFFNSLIGNKDLQTGKYGDNAYATLAHLNDLTGLINFNYGGATTIVYTYNLGLTAYVPVHIINGGSTPVGKAYPSCTGCATYENNYKQNTLWRDCDKCEPYCVPCAEVYNQVEDHTATGKYVFTLNKTIVQDPTSPVTDVMVQVVHTGPKIIAGITDQSDALAQKYEISFWDTGTSAFVDAIVGTKLIVTYFKGNGEAV